MSKFFRGVRLEKRLYPSDFKDLGITEKGLDENYNAFGQYYLGSDGCIYEFTGNPSEGEYVRHLEVEEFKRYFNESNEEGRN